MVPDGVKTADSDTSVTKLYAEEHLKIGIESLQELASSGDSVKHMIFE